MLSQEVTKIEQQNQSSQGSECEFEITAFVDEDLDKSMLKADNQDQKPDMNEEVEALKADNIELKCRLEQQQQKFDEQIQTMMCNERSLQDKLDDVVHLST